MGVILWENYGVGVMFAENIYNASKHFQVGKYFVEYDENIGYIANKELTQKYPQDTDVQIEFEISDSEVLYSTVSNLRYLLFQ